MKSRRGKPTESPTAPESGTASPSALRFDPENPRFLTKGFRSEEEIVRHLYDDADVDELLQSILSSGYLDFEPLIVRKRDSVVLEGNRRLAALRLISDETLRRRLKIELPDIPSPQPLPSEVRVLFVREKADARGYIGFKHVNGPQKWDPLAKARYAAEWFADGGDIDAISRTLGDNHDTVRRIVSGWYTLEQAKANGFDPEDISKRLFAFSHLYTALTRPSVREYLGLPSSYATTEPAPDPVPKSHIKELQTLMSWLYGQEKLAQPALVRSQNPHLNQLVRVLAHPVARKALMADRNLEAAHELLEPASQRFAEALLSASERCEAAMKLSGHYEGEEELLAVAEGMENTVAGLVVVMRNRPDRTKKREAGRRRR